MTAEELLCYVLCGSIALFAISVAAIVIQCHRLEIKGQCKK
jgi:hypothetical protein